MCPIIQAGGEVVGFSGRLLPGDPETQKGAKYINSPESRIYKKSKLLFGMHQAREAIRNHGQALLVEGNFDVVRLHQHGFRHAVAALGTALTAEQAQTLRRIAGGVTLLYDGDKAGRAATLTSLKTLLSQDVTVRIGTLPLGQDPDSLIADEGPESLEKILARAQPAIEYFVHEIWLRSGTSSQGRAKALSEAAQVFKSISDSTQRDFAVGTLASAFRVDQTTIRRGFA